MVNQIRWFIGLDPSDTVQKCAEHDIVVEAYSPFAHGLIVYHPEIGSGEDHLQPPSVQRSNAKHYKSNTLTEVKEYPGYAHCCPPRRVGSGSPTTPWPGPWNTRGDRGAPDPDHTHRRNTLLEVGGLQRLPHGRATAAYRFGDLGSEVSRSIFVPQFLASTVGGVSR
jgi:hypothetical protein